jgi:hypothetical protein
MHAVTPWLTCGAVALALAGCGSTSKQSTAAALKLHREDLVAVTRALKRVQTPVAQEAATTKRVWPQIAGGTVAEESAPRTPGAGRAVAAVTRLKIPTLFGELQARSLTGPAASIAGLFRYSVLLSTRGWSMLIASSTQMASGPPSAAHFASENVGLYIESIYDGHFGLAQIGKKLLEGYEKLGGPAAFGVTLTQAEVDVLAHTYSEATLRLYPHPPIRVGS